VTTTETVPAPVMERASVAAPRPELDWERQLSGRPLILPNPAWEADALQAWARDRATEEGEVPYTRVTTFAEALQDASALTRWKGRRILIGASRRPDYVTAAAALTTEDRDRDALDDLAEKCLEASGPNAADVGTALHGFTERLDRGEDVGVIPAMYVESVEAYARAVSHLRFTHHEVRTVCDELEVAGTPDRFGFCDIPDPDGVVDELRVIDTKTGRVDYSAGKFSTQLSIYAHSDLYHPGTGAREPLEVNTRWGLIVHAPAGAGYAELLWIELEHGWAGAQLCKLVRTWRTNATSRKLLHQVFARAPRPRPDDGTCRGRKQDGKPCGYRRKSKADGLGSQFCGRHQEQADQLARWLAENPDADPDSGMEELPSRDPVQPSSPPAVDLTQPATETVTDERCLTTDLLVDQCACDVHRPDLAETAAAIMADVPSVAADGTVWETDETITRPVRELVVGTDPQMVAGQWFTSNDEPMRQGPVGTYALDPDTEVNGNPRPHSGLQSPEDAEHAGQRAAVFIMGQIGAARSQSELELIWRSASAAGTWNPQHANAAGRRAEWIRRTQPQEKPGAALLTALETAPDQETLEQLWRQYGQSDLWTSVCTVTADNRYRQLAAMAQL
jgi:hypothetical protein